MEIRDNGVKLFMLILFYASVNNILTIFIYACCDVVRYKNTEFDLCSDEPSPFQGVHFRLTELMLGNIQFIQVIFRYALTCNSN